MNSMTVLYDENCGFCRRAGSWLRAQRQLVRLDLVPAGSAEARRKFPVLDHASTFQKITVVADNGAVYEGDDAWLMCLWSLTAWRPMAVRLSKPGRERFVRAATRVADRLREASLGRENEPRGSTCTHARCA